MTEPKSCLLCSEGVVNPDDWKRGERFCGAACEDEWCNVAGRILADRLKQITMPSTRPIAFTQAYRAMSVLAESHDRVTRDSVRIFDRMGGEEEAVP